MRKLDIEEVKQEFINRDLIPLFDEYNSANERLLAQTKEGYVFLISLSHLKNGRNPGIFHTSNPYTIQNIKLWCKLNDKPFELISDKYEKAIKNLKWIHVINLLLLILVNQTYIYSPLVV